MAIKNTKLGGTDLIDDELGVAADWNDTFEAAFTKAERFEAVYLNSIATGYPRGVVRHSDTVWSIVDADGDIWLYNDGTLTEKNTDMDTDPCFITLCKADSTHAFAMETGGSAETAFTDDSGSTWTSKTATGLSSTYDVSFPTTGLIVISGTDGSNKPIQYSTDDGATWNDCTTNITASIVAVEMFDGSTGYGVDTSGNIWKTTDGGDNWTDTGDNFSISIGDSTVRLITLSATEVLKFASNNRVEHYDNSTNTVTIVYYSAVGVPSDAMILSDGSVVTVMHSAASYHHHLIRSTDNGTTWTLQLLPSESGFNASPANKRGGIAEMSTGQLLLRGVASKTLFKKYVI
jgi:hypothetical protein